MNPIRKWVSPQLEEARRQLKEMENRIEIKNDVGLALDRTEEILGNQLQETVRKQQHGLATHVEVEDAARKLNDFKENRWQKQSRIEKLVDESFAEKK